MQSKLTAYIRVSTIWKEGDRFFLNGKIVRRESLQLATVISYVAVNVHVDCLHTEPKKKETTGRFVEHLNIVLRHIQTTMSEQGFISIILLALS